MKKWCIYDQKYLSYKYCNLEQKMANFVVFVLQYLYFQVIPFLMINVIPCPLLAVVQKDKGNS